MKVGVRFMAKARLARSIRRSCLYRLLTTLSPMVFLIAIGPAGAYAQSEVAAKPQPAAVDAARLIKADSQPDNWMTSGRTYSEQRFSPLDLINVGNVVNLKLAWFYDLETARGQEATPLVVDGVMYVSTAWSIVKSFNAGTGQLLWSYDPKVPRKTLIKVCCDAVNRGVAVWKGKVYVGTIDGRLIALNAADGNPAWSVQTVDPNKPYTITSAPRAIDDKIVIGNSGSEFGVRGYISAYDAATGRLAWRFYTVPGDPAKPFEAPILKRAAKTWHGQWWKEGGGGTVWSPISYDPDLDLLYFGTANGTEWDQKHRSPGGGDNWFLASIVALKASTGEYVWHYQVVPGDVWDYDATQNMVLADLTIDGQPRKVLMQASKDGFYYVIDRATGKLISAKNFVPVTWASGIDRTTGRPIENPTARYDVMDEQVVLSPSANGGHNWQPMAFNPRTGLAYIPANQESFAFAPDEHFKAGPVGINLGIDLAAMTIPPSGDARRDALAKEKGFLLAWDPVQQKEVWRAPHDGPANGGVLTTAGNLVFQGTATGNFEAYRADTGKKVWSMPVQTGVIAGPMSYQINGEQYVALLAGTGGNYALFGGGLPGNNQRNISRVLAFRIDGKANLPPLSAQQPMVLDPPPVTASAKVVAQGRRAYGRYCAICHGVDAISGGLVPDLRYSGLLGNSGWFKVVLDGALQGQGMVSFAKVLKRDQAAAIRAYVIGEANVAKEAVVQNPTMPVKQAGR
jgi:quinohemoprotein ethanol dehydrogenase